MGLGLDNYRRNLVPWLGNLTGNGQADLLLSEATGRIRYLENIRESRQGGQAELQELIICEGEQGWLGARSWPVAVQLRNGSAPDLMIGNQLGGLWLLQTEEPVTGGGGDGFRFRVYPNPVFSTREHAWVQANQEATIRLYSISGQLLREMVLPENTKRALPLAGLADGMYVVQARHRSGSFSSKLIIVE